VTTFKVFLEERSFRVECPDEFPSSCILDRLEDELQGKFVAVNKDRNPKLIFPHVIYSALEAIVLQGYDDIELEVHYQGYLWRMIYQPPHLSAKVLPTRFERLADV
jgi:hypothetical protein